VHFPIALSALVPLFAALMLAAIHTSRTPRRSWALIVLLQALLAASAYVAHDTGHDQEERVEKVVDERFIEEHEEAASWLLYASLAGLVIVAGGLAAGRPGAWARGVSLVFSLVTLGIAVRTGQLGGDLVYRHGATDAYVERPAADAPP
jgi:hypothetical protein